ncbi:ninein-like protein isoform X2 [Ptychodera flava]|uniref:ninein-like protein isoform X2 n=1 Tax=Ptychodera flava TaxID=63121 RepID=UPI00396A0A9E
MMDDDIDQDVYVAQLKEVFDSCDTQKNGKIDRNQLKQLCHKLQLEDQTDNLLEQLLGDDFTKKVDFEEFKEGFVLVLSNAVEDIESEVESEDEEDEYSGASSHRNYAVQGDENKDDANELEPKYVKDGKRYGRRSKPDFMDSDNDNDNEYNTTEYSDTDTSYMSPRHTPRSTSRSKKLSLTGSVESVDYDDEESDGEDSDGSADDKKDNKNETFEAEGQLNTPRSLMEVTSPTDEVQVKAIWDDVGVGQNGYLDVKELAIVCEHIGMEGMNQEELENLFEKLDVDGDKRVSFDEFVHGLFIHGSVSALSTSPSVHLMSPAQKSKLRIAMMNSSMDEPVRTATPSYLTMGYDSLTFSVLDPDNSGFASPEDIAQQWQSQGIDNPQEVLEALEVDAEGGKLNIQDLSTALEHVLLTTGDDNGVYQAALTTYQRELKHLKSQLDTVTNEREKLKNDLYEANVRNSTLIQEVDDRHANIEKSMESKIIEAEKKHHEKINSLQAEIDKEREMMSSQAAKQKQQLEEIIDQLRGEEALLKEKLALLQKENNRLNTDVIDLAEKLEEYEKTNQKLQKDLEEFNTLQQRLAEFEAQEDHINEKQVQFYQQNLKEYQEQNRGLRDENDELLQQIQILQQQLSERKLRRRGSRSRDLSTPNRKGSVLSDYAKPTVIRRRDELSSTEDESEDEDGSTSVSGKRKRRQLPVAMRSGGDGGSNEDEDYSNKTQDNSAKHAEEIEELKKSHNQEINEQRVNFERERKDIEQAYKMEITDLEDDMATAKEEFAKQRDNWRTALEEQEKGAKEEKEETERKSRKEMLHLREEFDREKMEMLQSFAREKADLRDKLEAEYNEDLDNKIADVKETLLRERADLEDRYTREKLEIGQGYARDKTQTEMAYKRTKSELEVQFTAEKSQLEQQHEKEKADLERMYKKQMAELEQIFVKGEAGLKGQLRADFNELLEQHKRELEASLEKDKQDMRIMFEKEKEQLQREIDREKSELSKSHKQDKLSSEEKMKKELEEEKAKMESKVRQKLKREMEDAFVEQIERIKEAHEEEKDDFKKENRELQEKLEKTEKRLKALEVEREDAVTTVKMHTVQAAASPRSTLDKSEDRYTYSASPRSSSENIHRKLQEKEKLLTNRAAYEDMEKQKSMLELKVRALEQKLKTRSQMEVLSESIQATVSMTEKMTQTSEENVKTQNRNISTQTERNVLTRAQQTVIEGVRPNMKAKMTQTYREVFNKSIQYPDVEEKGWLSWLLNKDDNSTSRAVQASTPTIQRGVQTVNDNINRKRDRQTQTEALEKTLTRIRQTQTDDLKTKMAAMQTEPEEKIETFDQRIQTEKELIESLVLESEYRKTTQNKEAKLEMLEEERVTLKRELKDVNQKLLEARTALSLSQSQHIRELQRLRDQRNEISEKEVQAMNLKLAEREKRLQDMEKVIRTKEEELNKGLHNIKSEYDGEMKSLRDERAEIEKKHRSARGLLDDYVIKLKEQLNKSTKRDMLLKELYIENAQLMKALAETEEREKAAERTVYKLSDKNKALSRLLRKVCPAAL